MERYANFREYFSGQLWAVRPEMLSIMSEILQRRIEGNLLTSEEISARVSAAQRFSGKATGGTVAVLPLYGVIDQKISIMSQISGGTSVDGFMQAFRAALNDDAVTGILLDVDSPGGSIAGVQEAAMEILASRGKKPIVAISNTLMASGAYWIASAADEVYCMQSGQVGCIGIIAVHDDYSKANEIEGYKPTYIVSAQYKTESNPNIPLSEDALAYKQQQVDAIGDMFNRFIAKARGIPVDSVRSGFGQGRTLLPKDAMAVKMIDGIATIEQAIARVASLQAEGTALIPKGLMSDAEQAITAMQSISERFQERKALREKTKGMSSDEALTDSNKEAIKSAHAATCDVIGRLEDAKGSLIALLEPAPIITQPQTEETLPEATVTVSSDLERTRLALAMTVHSRNKQRQW